MDSIDQIRSNISEINIMLDYSKQNQTDIKKYQMFNKVAVIMLCTKVEVFLEEFMDEHSRMIIQGHTNTSLPTKIKDIFVETAVSNASGVKKKNDRNSFLQSLMTLLKDDGCPISNITNIRPSTKFSCGKHGQKEIESLFKRHGLEQFIRTIDAQNYLRKMNSLFAIRNNVIHEDACPSLTHQTIEDHIENILDFVKLIEEYIKKNHQFYYNH